jgi:hypothetical protein
MELFIQSLTLMNNIYNREEVLMYSRNSQIARPLPEMNSLHSVV